MPYFIKSEDQGLLIGECLGFGFYEADDFAGEEPIPFNTREEAQECMNSWVGGIPKDHSIIATCDTCGQETILLCDVCGKLICMDHTHDLDDQTVCGECVLKNNYKL